MSEKHTQRCTGYWIPIELEQMGLSPIEEKLLSMIDSLEKPSPEYCFASNEYLAAQLEVSPSIISRYISHLKKLKFIEQVSFAGRIRRLKSLKHNWYLPEEERIISKKESYAQSARNHTHEVTGIIRMECEDHNIYIEEDNKTTTIPKEIPREEEQNSSSFSEQTTEQEQKPAEEKSFEKKIVADEMPKHKRIQQLEDLDINEATKENIYRSFSEERILNGIEYVKSKSGISNVGAYLFTAIQEEYELSKTKVEIAIDNKSLAKEIFGKYDDSEVRGVRITICNQYLEIGRSCYMYEDSDFQEKILQIAEKLGINHGKKTLQ